MERLGEQGVRIGCKDRRPWLRSTVARALGFGAIGHRLRPMAGRLILPQSW